MTDEHGETLSRLLDGEPIDEARLREALAQPEAVRWLLESLNLRHVLLADLGEPDEQFCDAMRQRLRGPGWRGVLQAHWVPAAVAASLLLAGTSVGYGLRWWREPPTRLQPSSAPQLAIATSPPAPASWATPSTPARRQLEVRQPAPPAPQTRQPFTQWRDGSQPD